MWQKRKVSKISIVILTSLFLLGLINIINIPKVFAAVTIYQQNTSAACNNTSSCAQLFSLTVVSGDILVATQIVNSITVTPTFSDTGGATWHTTCSATAFEQPCTSWAIATTSAADTVTVTWGGTHTGFIKVLEIQGGDSTNICIKTNHASSGTAVSTATSCTWTSTTAFGMFTVGTGSATHTCTTPAGWTDGSFGAGAQVKYFVGSGVSSPTNFACTLSGSDLWDEVGMLIPESIPLVTQPLSICTQELGTNGLGIIIPLYDPPGFNSDWTTIENSATSNPNIKFTVIVNVANGAGSAQSPTYTSGINAMLAAGVRVIGYEYTLYSHRSIPLVETDIQHWTSFYPQINGIFFDQMGNTAGNASYYTQLNSFAMTQNYASFFSEGNPGASVASASTSLYGIFTSLNIWEKVGTPSTTALAASTGTPASAFAFISNGISTGADTNSTYLNTITPYVGNIFITSSNAYTALPSYWATEVSNVALTASGVPSGTFALSGGANPSPATLASQNKGSCTFTNITVMASQTLIVTVPTDNTYTRFRMNSSATSSTTQNIATCATGTCTSKTVDVYYQVSNSYGVQAINPTKFNGNIMIVLLAFNAGSAVTQNLPITLGSTTDTIGYTFFDFGTVSFPTQFTVKGLTWTPSPASAALVSNTNIGGSQLIVGYIGGNQSTGVGTLTRTVIVTVISTVLIGNGASCTDTASCTTNQFGSFITFLLPSLILLGLFMYVPYKMHIRDERIFIFVFMLIISGICYASSLQSFGSGAIPWYIGIFVDITGFLLIITYSKDRGTITSE